MSILYYCSTKVHTYLLNRLLGGSGAPGSGAAAEKNPQWVHLYLWLRQVHNVFLQLHLLAYGAAADGGKKID